MEPIEECFIFLLNKANQQLQALTRERLLEFGVTTTQYAVLRVLWERDGQSAAELGERLQLDAATLVGVLDRLAQAGLVVRKPHPQDRRVNLVYLTGPGRGLEQPLSAVIQQINQDVEARFARELPRVRRVLAELGKVHKEAV